MNKPRVGDIYRWEWNSKTLKEMEDKKNAGTLYWCCSKICVFKDGQFWDTYWGGNDCAHEKTFTIKEANEKLSLRYLVNSSELVRAGTFEKACYEDKDCFDLNHSNSLDINFFIRKGAKKSLDKMRRVTRRSINKLQRDIDLLQHKVNQLETDLQQLSLDSILTIIDGVSLTDNSYED